MHKLLLIIFIFLSSITFGQSPMRLLLGKHHTGVIDTVYSDTSNFATATTSSSVSGWADFSNSGAAPHTQVKTVTQGTYTLSTNATAAWNVFGGATHNDTGGEDTNDGGGFAFNSTVQRKILFNYNDTYSGSTTDANFKISGLTVDSLYVIELMSTRETGTSRECTVKLIDGNGTTTYTTWMDGTRTGNGNSPTSTGVLATGNTSKFFRMYGKALSGGFIYLWIGGTDNASDVKRFGIAAGLRIYKMTISSH